MKELLNKLKENYMEDPLLSLDLVKQILPRISELSYQHKSSFYFIYGWILFDLSKDHDALECFEKALTISRENGFLPEESQALMGKGVVLARAGNIIQGTDALVQSLEIAKQLKHYRRIIGTTICYSRLLSNLGEYDNSITMLQEVLPAAKGDRYFTTLLYRNLALDFSSNLQYDESVVMIKSAINNYKNADLKRFSYLQAIVDGLKIYYESKEYDLFEETLKEAVYYVKKYPIPRMRLKVDELHSKYLLKKKNYKKALKLALDAESLAIKEGNKKILQRLYLTIKDSYINLDDIDNSLKYYDKLYSISQENQENSILTKQAIEEMILKEQWQQKMSEVEGEKNIEITHYLKSIESLRGELKDAKKRITHLSNHDPLTQLPNRMLLKQFFSQMKSRANRNNERLGLFTIDIEHFKKINNIYGFNAGDKTLCELAERLNHLLRGSDVVGRVGNDEFVILCCEIDSMNDIKIISEKIEKSISKPVHFEGKDIDIKAKIGFSIFPDNGSKFDDLFKTSITSEGIV